MSVGLLLVAGFFIGIRHALEADHVAAVASLTSRQTSLRHALQQGYCWGLGHTLTLLTVGGTVLWLDTLVPEALVHWLEFGVGVMLVALGVDALYRHHQECIPLHPHPHQDNKMHVHRYNQGEKIHKEKHDHSLHPHEYANQLVRPLLVGLVHGMAGSGALMVLTLQTVGSAQLGLLYVALFGLGSVFGMALLSVAIAIPLRYSIQYAIRFHFVLCAGIGLFTVTLGLITIVEQGFLIT